MPLRDLDLEMTQGASAHFGATIAVVERRRDDSPHVVVVSKGIERSDSAGTFSETSESKSKTISWNWPHFKILVLSKCCGRRRVFGKFKLDEPSEPLIYRVNVKINLAGASRKIKRLTSHIRVDAVILDGNGSHEL